MDAHEPITLLTCRDAAALLNTSHTTIHRWVKQGRLIPYARTCHTRIKLFRAADVQAAALRIVEAA